MATKLQRKCLWQMIHHNSRAVFVTAGGLHEFK